MAAMHTVGGPALRVQLDTFVFNARIIPISLHATPREAISTIYPPGELRSSRVSLRDVQALACNTLEMQLSPRLIRIEEQTGECVKEVVVQYGQYRLRDLSALLTTEPKPVTSPTEASSSDMNA